MIKITRDPERNIPQVPQITNMEDFHDKQVSFRAQNLHLSMGFWTGGMFEYINANYTSSLLQNPWEKYPKRPMYGTFTYIYL